MALQATKKLQQGIIAGINASQSVKQQDTFELKRDEAYIGVLIDDLVSQQKSRIECLLAELNTGLF